MQKIGSPKYARPSHLPYIPTAPVGHSIAREQAAWQLILIVYDRS